MKQYFIDITGQKFGKLTVIKYSKTFNKRAYWICKCDCGKEKETTGKSLRAGLTQSCGCLHLERVKTRRIDLTGQKFNFLLVLNRTENPRIKNRAFWDCQCDCGNQISIDGQKLKDGHTKSCGCLHRKSCSERAIKRNKLMIGPKSPRWRHDLTEEYRKSSYIRELNPKYYKWRKKVYEKDNYTCQCCNDNRGGNLEAHHIYSWDIYLKLRYIKSNGITFCQSCHKKFHFIYGYGQNTRKQLNEFLKFFRR